MKPQNLIKLNWLENKIKGNDNEKKNTKVPNFTSFKKPFLSNLLFIFNCVIFEIINYKTNFYIQSQDNSNRNFEDEIFRSESQSYFYLI